MSSVAIIASLFLAATSEPSGMDKAAQAVNQTLTADEIGQGPLIELDIFTLSGGPTSQSAFSALGVGSTSTSAVLVAPAVQVGWEFDQNALLIGMQFTFVQGTSTIGGTTNIALPLTYRRYLKALAVNAFDPFVEAAGTLNFVVPSNSSVQLGFGVNAGFGGEWLFTRNFGLMGKALLGYQHIPLTISGQNINAFGFGGVLGVLVHF